MNATVLLLGFSVVLSVAAIGVGLLVVLADDRSRAGLERCQAALQAALDGLAARVQEIELHPPAAATPPGPRAGLNISKRSQVLRMHRKGDQPDRIAAALEIPLHEVDLLIKVHRIVIGSL
jgi:hypothetical protein